MMLYNIPAAQDPNRNRATIHWRLYHGYNELPTVVEINNETYTGYDGVQHDPDRFIGTWSYETKQEAATALTVLKADAAALNTYPAPGGFRAGSSGPQC